MITERAWDRERRVVRVGDGGMGKNGGINLKDLSGDGVTDIYPKIETTYQKRRPKTPRRVAAPEFLDVLKIDVLLNPV